MYEFQVTLSLPVESQTVQEAVEEFKLDVASGVAYVYSVDTGERVVHFDDESKQIFEAEDNLKDLLSEASERAEREYPFKDGEDTTSRTVKLVLREGFVKGYMKARGA
jgi:hypothetical protein